MNSRDAGVWGYGWAGHHDGSDVPSSEGEFTCSLRGLGWLRAACQLWQRVFSFIYAATFRSLERPMANSSIADVQQDLAFRVERPSPGHGD